MTACSLGRVLVVATGRGLCGIELGDDDEALLELLVGRFPGARVAPAEPPSTAILEAVVALLDGGADARLESIALDLRGTTFQQTVWRALRAIPPGETVSYRELAQRLGKPNATRAVARACAENRLAVAVPCHRVVRSDGGLGGYRWGLERKRTLLDRERTCAQATLGFGRSARCRASH